MYQTITIDQLEQYLDQGQNVVLIDLRNKASFAANHLQGAVNIPYEELEQKIDTLPKDRLWIFYCSRGGQSMRACNRLSAKGYRVLNVANGLSAYRGKYLERT